MMDITNVCLLLVINFLHFLSTGVIYPVVGRQIIKTGGNPVLVGAMQSAVYISHRISKDFVELFESGKKSVISMSLHLSLLYFSSMIFVSTWWFVLAMRICCALTTQVHPYSKALIAKTHRLEERAKIINLLEIMKVAGLSSGAVTGGCLFYWYRNFTLNATVASGIAFLSVFLIYFLKASEVAIYASSSQIFFLKNAFYRHFKNLKETELKEKWNDVILKIMFIITFAVYFTRFAFILAYNYRVTTLVIGLTRAYYYVVVFICSCLIPFAKQQFEDKKTLLEKVLLIAVGSLFALFYAPTYWCYLFCYLPLLFFYQLANSLLEEDALGLKENIRVYLATDTIGTLIAASTPFLFAVVSEIFGKPLTKLLSLIPAIYLTFLLNQRVLSSRAKQMSEENILSVSTFDETELKSS